MVAMTYPTHPHKKYKFSAYIFCCWFFVIMLWLPTAVGGWLVYFDLLEAGNMWVGSLVISFFVALYMARSREEGLGKRD